MANDRYGQLAVVQQGVCYQLIRKQTHKWERRIENFE